MNNSQSNTNISDSPTKLQSSNPIFRVILVILLMVLIAVAAIPGYLQGKWSWSDLPKIVNINQIKNLSQTGINLTPWRQVERKTIELGTGKWSVQLLEKDEKQIYLLLMPQNYYKDKPEVEWMDITGLARWKTDSYSNLDFTVPGNSQPIKVTAHLFRAWTPQQTFAVVQWYAWPTGGHFSPEIWFWSDLWQQLQHQRLPWVAVCLQIPMEPLGNVEKARPLAESLAKTVQETLLKSPLSGQK